MPVSPAEQAVAVAALRDEEVALQHAEAAELRQLVQRAWRRSSRIAP